MDFVGTVQFFDRNEKRNNPVSLFLENLQGESRISSRLPRLRHIVGVGATPNKAAGDFEGKLKAAFPEPGAYDGPSWNGIKAEKPSPPKPAPAPGTTPADTAAVPTLSPPPAGSEPPASHPTGTVPPATPE
jgi:hypothetical protein